MSWQFEGNVNLLKLDNMAWLHHASSSVGFVGLEIRPLYHIPCLKPKKEKKKRREKNLESKSQSHYPL